MSVISGETGAGKSIMLDALGLTLGDRADSSVVRIGADKADILASFDLTTSPTPAPGWPNATWTAKALHPAPSDHRRGPLARLHQWHALPAG